MYNREKYSNVYTTMFSDQIRPHIKIYATLQTDWKKSKCFD